MGKTLEHLGSQLYKRRDAAIAELIANSWDAEATTVAVVVPETSEYDPNSSELSLTDTGVGMSAAQVEDQYLVIGRNRREDQPNPSARKVMGRKGIGKLAGFGIATEVELITWQQGRASRVVMPIEKLKRAPGRLDTVDLFGEEDISPPPDVASESGSRVILRGLRHVTPMDPSTLRESLARRFSRTVRGTMSISVNGEEVQEAQVDLEQRVPEEGWLEENVDGNPVRFFYGFSRRLLKPAERRGFVIYVHGKTAQAPPYFFDVEGTATGQHGTRYLFGEIEADFLDDGISDEGDVMSTDRQEIDWDNPVTVGLKSWGDQLTRRALRELRQLREDRSEEWVLEEPVLQSRIAGLSKPARERVTSWVRVLGRSDNAERERVIRLADGLVAAFEYQHFHDLLEEIEEVSEDPDQLGELVYRMLSWKTLESRALLEVVQGRLEIIDKFHRMVAEDVPEVAAVVGMENMHDLLTSFPWLIHPEWQTFEHERRIDSLLRDWMDKEPGLDRERVDFLALSDVRTLKVVEIKRPRAVLSLDEYQRLQRYMDKLRAAWSEKSGNGDVEGLLICTELNFDERQIGPQVKRERWADLYRRVRDLYEHYRAILEHDVLNRGFTEKKREVAQTRSILRQGAYLDKTGGRRTLGSSDVEFSEDE
jgi:hypothetical protein